MVGNLYLRNFLGVKVFCNEDPFKALLIVYFRKQISVEMIDETNEALEFSYVVKNESSVF